ncbi:MAG: SpoIIE family protein phosphatase [Ignavibacteria bacterium]|nr:SpoIIE family protein phosphatase [Ignavibacteria bacterium]
MDLSLTFDKYLDYTKEEAYTLFCNEKNLKILRRFVYVLIVVFGIVLLVNSLGISFFSISAMLMLFSCLASLFLGIYYKKIFSISNVRKYIFTILIATLLIFLITNVIERVFYPEQDKLIENVSKVEDKGESKVNDSGDIVIGDDERDSKSYTDIIFFFAIAILFFKLSRNEITQFYALIIGLPLITELIIFNSFETLKNVPVIIFTVLFYVIALTAESKRRKTFCKQYDYYHKKDFESHRMKKELNYAREIQLSMLPEREARFGDLEISAISIPATEVGGDYFDYFKISDDKVGVFICDVSGHGVASALLLSGLRSCMHLILEETSDPKEVFEKLNRMIRKTQNRKMFVTAVFTVIDMKKNTCILYNAGHLPPYKISGDSSELFKIKRHGITLGAMESIEPSNETNEMEFDFNKNDKLIFYTDGVNEALNSDKSEYGFEKLESFLNTNADRKPNDLLKKLVSDVNNFTQDTAQKDDLTILTIGRN